MNHRLWIIDYYYKYIPNFPTRTWWYPDRVWSFILKSKDRLFYISINTEGIVTKVILYILILYTYIYLLYNLNKLVKNQAWMQLLTYQLVVVGWQSSFPPVLICFGGLSNYSLVRYKNLPPHLMVLHCFQDQLSMYAYDSACQCYHMPIAGCCILVEGPNHFYQRWLVQ